MAMSELVKFLESLYIKAKRNDFEWKYIYPNNMLENDVVGIYTDMFFERDSKYTYLKYSIEYCSRCDKDGMSHPEEGTRYYVLHRVMISLWNSRVSADDHVYIVGDFCYRSGNTADWYLHQ